MASRWRQNIADQGLWGTGILHCARILNAPPDHYLVNFAGFHRGLYGIWHIPFPGEFTEVSGGMAFGPFPYGMSVEDD